MASVLTLKIKAGSEQSVIKDLTSSSSLSDLTEKVSCFSGIAESRLKLLAGFPPKILELGDKNKSLVDAGIKSGDVIMAQERPASPVMTEAVADHREEHTHPAPTPQSSDLISSYSAAQATGGMLMRQVVPSDNSCLFTSINYVLNGKVETGTSHFMRDIIAEKVRNDPENYNEAFLGKTPSEYCSWIKKSEAWGGAIELSILSSFYGFEIVVVNSLHGIVNRFGEDQKYGMRAFLIYDGIHYDPLYLEPFDGSALKTLFPTTDEQILEQALELAQESRSSRQFTDVQEFTIKCLQCQVVLKGQVAAQQHAKDTGHVSFGEL
ncbi:ubiquitin thioesterase OTU1 [Neocloeon triangulifer]|uniref:ubiquitin thioesterase OTU1 n=1 Tax=Neocloeon triangulifer TaxID=2078957 RepID=UPI00286EF41B|nr:ubiquitin thioesterase OTU1 [Neocloeon triangulifer]